ncbi:DNA repair protein RecO [Oceanomicrobium pacificus]|uniref:DNA repair protein RecO n=1 Tax=Oceanomicrobium pacificus TaxID=2692916 RepID=A0A6B0TRH0_9RHOB|nr:DNA repair protein RecO [Oceanomicrobium pacificus]MXU63954.1 DNA repair protein RecO [Oceanomicrobium pacificus]
MEWRDEGILVSVRPHGEGSAILEMFTAEHGRHFGLVRGGGSRRMAPVLQPGAQLSVEWRARLEEHLGSYTVDPIRSRAAQIMSDRASLAAASAAAALISLCLPEREAHRRFYARTLHLMDAIGADPHWRGTYVRWELALLAEMGFGLDFTECAATGVQQDLIYVSPKSGRAVSRRGGEDYADRLLPLPRFLHHDDPQPVSEADAAAGLRMTGHFLRHWLLPALGRDGLPPARERLDRAMRATGAE